MTFSTWRKQQTHRDDPIGDRARDAVRDPDVPRRGGWPGWPQRTRDQVLFLEAAAAAVSSQDEETR